MKYRGIFEYEYPTEHKPPVSIDVYLHGDCVKGKIIEWEYRPLEQEPILDKIRAEIVDTLYVDSLIFGELIDFRNGKISADDVIEEFNRVTKIEVLKILDKYKSESEDKG